MLSRLSARLALSSNSLTRAKRDVKIRKPFLSLICIELKGGRKENFTQLRGSKSVNFREHRVEQGTKFSSFREISEFVSDCGILEVKETSSCNFAIFHLVLLFVVKKASWLWKTKSSIGSSL